MNTIQKGDIVKFKDNSKINGLSLFKVVETGFSIQLKEATITIDTYGNIGRPDVCYGEPRKFVADVLEKAVYLDVKP